MLRSLYTGISGMRAMQTLMDVTGNNIANVNTTGYKTTNTVFEDTLSQTLKTATASTGSNGGTNPAQVGLGVRVASISNNFTEGAAQTTGVNSNMMLNGDGFFVVRNNGINSYTRDGAFTPDAKGELVNGEGAQLMGWQADLSGAVVTNATTTPITIPTGLLSKAQATQTVTVTGNFNTAATGDKASTASTDEAKAAGSVVSMNQKIYDGQGNSSDLNMSFTPIDPESTATPPVTTITSWKVHGTYGGQAFDTTYTRPLSGTPSWGTATATPATGGFAVADDGSGNLKLTNLVGSDGNAFTTTVNMAKVTSTAQPGVQTSTAKVDSQDGHAAASLAAWQIGGDGTITGTFSDGTSQTLAKIAVATFNNPEGLEKEGGSMYSSTVNSGSPSIGVAGDNGRGTITSGALEMSNVDLSQEFTNLIIAQRGFQANSKIISTSDEILQTLVNLKQ